jgi:DNA-binding XRE family transcriptional regulator
MIEMIKMGRTLDEVMKSLPAARRRKIEARAKELIAEELTLQDLRKAMGKTQAELAKTLDVGQDAISRVEKRADMLLSTLSEHVRGLGGELKLVAEFPARAPVRITGFETLAPAKPAAKRKRAATRKRRKAA